MLKVIYKIRSRLQALEKAKQTNAVPELVIIYWDDKKQQWIAKEQYVKKDSNRNIIKNSGTVKLIPLDNPDSYIPPEGFKGSILKEGVIE